MLAASTMHDLVDWLTHLNWVDYGFMVIIVYSVITGVWIGVMAECISLAGVAAGVFVAGLTYDGAGSLLGHLGVPGDARDWAGFVAVFVIISLIFRVAAIFARKLSNVMVRGWSNRVAGGLLGLFVGAMLCLFILTTAAYFHVGKSIPLAHCYTPLFATKEVAAQCLVSEPMAHSKIATASTSWLSEFVTLLPVKMHTIPGFLPDQLQ
jgi:uncharacterized membrane protein required for colicin V production